MVTEVALYLIHRLVSQDFESRGRVVYKLCLRGEDHTKLALVSHFRPEKCSMEDKVLVCVYVCSRSMCLI